MTPEQILQDRLADLKASLDSVAPNFATLLREIHAQLLGAPELVHILKDEEIGVIVRGGARLKDITIVSANTAKAKSKKSQVTLEDLGL